MDEGRRGEAAPATSEDRRGVPLRRRSAASTWGAIGALWGLVGYSILWEGTPVEVSRAFVDGNPVATLILLPSRIVIGAILATEDIVGRTFDLSTSYPWIAPAAMLVGSLVGGGIAAAWSRLSARRRRSQLPL